MLIPNYKMHSYFRNFSTFSSWEIREYYYIIIILFKYDFQINLRFF